MREPPGGHLADGLLPLVHRQGARALGLRSDETLTSIGIPVGLEGASASTPEQQVAIALDAWLTGGGNPLPHPGEASTHLLDDEIDAAASASLRRLLGTQDVD